jgi:lysylphosphatidylglycerol synthetase-like protein (DUF2156 family)
MAVETLIDQRPQRITRSAAILSTVPAQLFNHPSAARRFELFRRYGNFTMAYATLQPGMRYFTTGSGYLAYDNCLGRSFVLGDPVAPVNRHAAILEAYVRGHPQACFCQVSKAVATILAEMGWFVNEFGADMELDLRSYDFTGPKKSKFRQAAHKTEREGYTIAEECGADSPRLQLDALCSSWLATKTVKQEARFLVRPFAFGDEPKVRNFILRDPQGVIVAFVTFDPMCEDGKVNGYSPAIKRRSTLAPTGAEEAITKFAIERFRAEGIKSLWLGLLPLHEIEDSGFREAWLLKKIFQWAYQHGDAWLYSFKGHADFKHRYRGALRKVYFATPTRWNAWNLIALMRLCRFW